MPWHGQLIDLRATGLQYQGQAESNVSREAILEDLMSMRGLTSDIKIRDNENTKMFYIMTTRVFCPLQNVATRRTEKSRRHTAASTVSLESAL